MATYQNVVTNSGVAGSAISPYRFVVIAADDGLFDHVASAQTVQPNGVSAEGVASGETFPYAVPNGAVVKVEAGGSITRGAAIASDDEGKAIAHVSGVGNKKCGVALEAADDGDIISVQFIITEDGTT